MASKDLGSSASTGTDTDELERGSEDLGESTCTWGSTQAVEQPEQESTANGESSSRFESPTRHLNTMPSPLQPLPHDSQADPYKHIHRPQQQPFSPPPATDRDQSPEVVNMTNVTMYFGEARNCPINILRPRLQPGASAPGAQRDFSVTRVSRFSSEFGSIISRIKAAIRDEGKEDDVLDSAAALTGIRPRDRVFPQAGEAQSIGHFFRLGSQYEWWNWLDFDRLSLLLDVCECARAQEILRNYAECLSAHVHDRLAALNANPPRSHQHWLEMKCDCDHYNITIEVIKEHKQFLMNRLRVPREAFTFCDYYEGCVTTIWVVHSPVQAEAIKQRILTFDGAKTQKTEHGSLVSAPCACDLTSVLFDLVRNDSLNVKGCTPEDLSVKSKQGETLLMAAVRRNNSTLVKELLEKGPPQDIKDFKDTELEQTAVTFAACQNYCKCLQVLLSYGCHPAIPDVAGKVPLFYACANDCASCVNQITRYDSGLKHLQWTVKFLSAVCVSGKVIQAIDLAKKRRQQRIVVPALFEAATSGNFAHAAEVLEEGDDLDAKDENGSGPAYVAACHGHLGFLKEWEMHGYKAVCFTEDKSTILHGAVLSGATNVVEYVLHCMADEKARDTSARGPPGSAPWDVNARNHKGESALELAAVKGHSDMIDLMVSRGASPCVPSSSGHLVSSQYPGVRDHLDVIRKGHALKLETAIKKKHTLAEFCKSWQDPYDHNLTTSSGHNMLLVAAEYGRHDVLQYLLDSLYQIPGNGSQVLTELQAAKGCSQADALQASGEDVRHTEGVDSASKAKHMLKSEGLMELLPLSPDSGFCDSGTVKGATAGVASNEPSPSLIVYLHGKVTVDGSTAAHRAAVTNMHRNLATLLDRCPSLANAQNSSGNTPLHLAVMWNNKTCIKVLMEPSRKTNFAIGNHNDDYPDQVFQVPCRLKTKLREKRVEQMAVQSREYIVEAKPQYIQPGIHLLPRSCSRGTLSPLYSADSEWSYQRRVYLTQ